ncbi:DUF4395 family protein [Salinadaptatus halalkaliphilus]|uniref:DUF4395 family protein n=1 Tax=Salinadaptatus halalkaliphilus TaxID=2419781 RepID=A0A4S3TKW6_9EURY|nr:DUF4395 family protein [Salinadaptatus halalkaliphilus]
MCRRSDPLACGRLRLAARWYRLLWNRLLIPIVGRRDELETAAPHRFAKLLGVVGSALATLALVGDTSGVGFGIAALVGLLAGLAATTGFCLGYRMYRQVSFLETRGIH